MTGRATVTATSRLRITTWVPDDLVELHRLHLDPEVMRFMRSGVETLDETRARLATFLAEQVDPGWTRWRVTDDDGHLVGRAGFRSPFPGAARELGYLLDRPWWGAGHATELVAALLAWHREHPGPGPTVHAQVYADHHASRAVLAKSGFELVGPEPAEPDLLAYRFVSPPA